MPGRRTQKDVLTALAEFGAPLQALTAADFAERGPFFSRGREPIGIDILTAISGIDVDAAWGRRVEDVIDPRNRIEGELHFR